MNTKSRTISPSVLVFSVSLFLVVFANWRFFHRLQEVYSWPSSAGFLFSLGAGLFLATFLILLLLSLHRATKPVLVLVLLVSSIIAYFSNSYGVAMDETMIQNVLKTDPREARDLFSGKIFLYFLFLGLLPSILVWRVRLSEISFRADLWARAKYAGIALLCFFGLIAISGKYYASFFREHKDLRVYANPLYFFYSGVKFSGRVVENPRAVLAVLGRDSVVSPLDKGRDLVILVLGETARADRFSLNGYGKPTNPELEKAGALSFADVSSCGTSTATSVPCLFSPFGRSDYTDKKARNSENLLDVLGNTKNVDILWRDNNSDSKGVALRVKYEDFTSSPKNTLCEGECRDEGMLPGLQEFIDRQPKGDILIVLHQMGNHGPAYYKRYPKAFEKFKPICATNQLEQCTGEAINNAYDNAILYTDHFLGKVIELLKQNDQKFHATMLYVSDHGESLGENGVYLHGMPYFIAPEAQRKVPLVFWFGDVKKSQLNTEALISRAKLPASHDNIFHTVLGLFEVETSVYKPELDLLRSP